MLDWRLGVADLSVLIQLYSGLPYIKGIIKGSVRPSVVSWLVWTVLQLIAVSATLTAGLSLSLLFIVAMTFNTTVVLFLAIFGYGYKHYKWSDFVCLTIAVLAIALWGVVREPIAAIILVVAADLIAAIPTIIKVYKDPSSEIPIAWFLVTIAAALGIAASTEWDMVHILYPTYFIGISALIGGMAYMGQRSRGKDSGSNKNEEISRTGDGTQST